MNLPKLKLKKLCMVTMQAWLDDQRRGKGWTLDYTAVQHSEHQEHTLTVQVIVPNKVGGRKRGKQ